MTVWVGVDASVKRDSTAVVARTFDHEIKKVRLVWHRIFQPSVNDPLDFEATIEQTLLGLRGRYDVREVRFDPWQMQAVAQRLQHAGLPMIEFPQSVPNLTEASTNLYELVKGKNLLAYPDADIRLAISRAVALETSRGWKIAKEKASHKIDVVVALAMAALAAIEQKPDPVEQIGAWYRLVAERQRVEDEAARHGKPRPPHDNPVSQAYVHGCEKWCKIFEEVRNPGKSQNRAPPCRRLQITLRGDRHDPLDDRQPRSRAARES